MNPLLLPRLEMQARFGNAVRSARFHHGQMSQEELGRRCGVQRQTIMAIEQGYTSPNVVLAMQICFVLDISMDTLVHGAPLARV